jgi:FkbM family methyltransferase
MQDVIKKAVVGSLWTMLGRRNIVRLGRLLSNEGRFDVSNDMAANGEFMVQQIAIRHTKADQKPVFFDVGANVGEWTRFLLKAARSQGVSLEAHAFEPCAATHEILRRNIEGEQDALRQVVARRKAMSSQRGNADLNIVGDGYGTNSLHPVTSGQVPARCETIDLETLDDYCREMGISHITLMKIDTEGHDMSVLEGGLAMLKQGAIELIQFEYNFRWVFSRHFLRDAFDLLAPLGYSIGKVTPKGIEFYREWHPELETFREGNYLACGSEWVARLPQIVWWNEVS